jgi:hypothetical protein
MYNYQLERACLGRKVLVQGLTIPVHGSGMGSFANCLPGNGDLETKVVTLERGHFVILMIAKNDIELPVVQKSIILSKKADPVMAKISQKRKHHEFSFKYGSSRSVLGYDYEANTEDAEASKDHTIDTFSIRPQK